MRELPKQVVPSLKFLEQLRPPLVIQCVDEAGGTVDFQVWNRHWLVGGAWVVGYVDGVIAEVLLVEER